MVPVCPAGTITVDGLTLTVILGVPTVCVNTADVDPVKFESPAYTAVMECVPALSDDVLNVACPVPFNMPIPKEDVPSINVTFPVGTVMFPLGAATAAVNVTDCPTAAGFCDDVTVVVVAGSMTAFTIWLSTVELDPAKLVSPL